MTQQQWQWPKRQVPGSTGGAPPPPTRGSGGPPPAPRSGGTAPPSRVTELRPGAAAEPAVTAAGADVNDDVKFRVHRRLIQELETARLDRLPAAEAREAVDAAARQILQQEAPGVYGLARDELIAAIVDEVLGLGPI